MPSLLRTLGLLLLPFILFAALFVATPAMAQTPPTTPTGGTFDCLGDYDWGCKIIGFIFEGTPVNYLKDGSIVSDTPGVVESGLRTMMGFFSNAILIIASLKLLYELIQMVAETAHAGTVGGKNTNQLWAPIRLVVAIGLLVPLASGMNSAQYIIMQIAKWGSGMASQTWKVFATALTENQRLPGPAQPQIYSLASATLKSFVCQNLVNYYTVNSTVSSDEIIPVPTPHTITTATDTYVQSVFGNKIHNDVCGQITVRLPNNITRFSNNDLITSARLMEANNTIYENHYDEIRQLALKYSMYFVPTKAGEKVPSTQEIDQKIQEIQADYNSNYDTFNTTMGQQELEAITNQIKSAADTYGWTTAGTWFLAITRAQGALITGGLTIPEATAPNVDVLQQYPDAYNSYMDFLNWYQTSTRPQDTVAPNTAVGVMKVDIQNDPKTAWAKIASTVGSSVIDVILSFMDGMGNGLGLWGDDPMRALGDLGGSTNPFGEIANLGQRHVRLGLNYIGSALVLSGAGGVVSGVANDAAGNAKANGMNVRAGVISGIGNAAGALIMFVGAIFFFFAFLFLIAGVLLGFVVPMLPFIRFFFAIVTWLGTLLEGMICAPFFALAFLSPNGEGFTGQHPRQALFLIFQIFLRPTLSLFGLIASIIMFYIGAKFLNASFYDAIRGIGAFTGSMSFLAKVIFTIAYVVMIYVMANASFKMMEQIPRQALRWMGGSASEIEHEGEGQQQALTAVGSIIGTNAITQQARSLMGIANNAGKGFQGMGQRSAQGRIEKKNQQKAKDQAAAEAEQRQQDIDRENQRQQALLGAIASIGGKGSPPADAGASPSNGGGGGGNSGGGAGGKPSGELPPAPDSQEKPGPNPRLQNSDTGTIAPTSPAISNLNERTERTETRVGELERGHHSLSDMIRNRNMTNRPVRDHEPPKKK